MVVLSRILASSGPRYIPIPMNKVYHLPDHAACHQASWGLSRYRFLSILSTLSDSSPLKIGPSPIWELIWVVAPQKLSKFVATKDVVFVVGSAGTVRLFFGKQDQGIIMYGGRESVFYYHYREPKLVVRWWYS